jgi:sugar/nucleoside kinase (ribokinase family)
MKILNKGIGVVGSTTIDKIVTEGQSYLKLGGVTTYAGITYRRHGIPTLIVSNLAEQDLKITNKLKAERIDVFRQTSVQTTHFVNYIKEHRRYQELPQQACPIGAGQIQAIIDRVDGLHLGPLHPLDIDPAALSLLRKSNRSIFLDVQGYTRMVKNKKIYPSVSDHLAAGLMAAQIIKANGIEYQAILDFYQMNLTELMIRFKIEESVVTLGENGGFVQTQSGETIKYAAETVNSPVDPTGAGDVFFAAYITSRFSNQMQIPDACRYAARIAAQQVEGKYITINQLGLG